MKCQEHSNYKGVYPPRVRCKDCRMVYTENQINRLTIKEIAEKLSLTEGTIKRYIKELKLSIDAPPEMEAYHEKEISEKERKLRDERKKSRARDKRIDELEKELEAVLQLNENFSTYEITPNGSKKNEAVAVAVASDWHIEEMVEPAQVSGMNQFNKEICQERVNRFWRHTVKLLNKEREAVEINTLVLALLGDFISGTIHDDLAETNRLLPADAIIEAETYLASGIQYLLDNTDVDIIIPCVSGNHGRMTKRQRRSAESGNSLERYMYHHLARVFEDEERITFVIADGYFIYLDIMGFTLRVSHGHFVRYYGGVGGLSIPLNKAVAKWNKGRKADLDILGHFHTFLDGGDWLVNGSLIGYNAYALSIKADYEPPRQAFFLIDEDDGKTVVEPVILEHDK